MFAQPMLALKPDLVIQSITHYPNNPTNRDLFEFRASVKNIGRDYSNPCKLLLKFGGETNGELFDVPQLSPGMSIEFYRRTICNRAANYRIYAEVDILHQVSESSESNNWKEKWVTVTLPLPDLIIDRIYCPDRFKRIWSNFEFYVTVKNVGPFRASPSILWVKFQRSHCPGIASGYPYDVEKKQIPALNPGGSQSIPHSPYSPYSPHSPIFLSSYQENIDYPF